MPALPVMFVITSMPVGGAETLLVNLIRRMDRSRFAPELCCLKSLGPLGEEMQKEIPTFTDMLSSKWDVGVCSRLAKLYRERGTQAVITVGAGDKMFWGRLGARFAKVPVVLSAIHSTGWPDVIGTLNKMLTPITDGFIGVASAHGDYLTRREGFPAAKVHVIPNGVDCERFSPTVDGSAVRAELGIAASAPVCGIVAALRPEKNHAGFLRSAALTRKFVKEAQFLIVGDGPERPKLEALRTELGLDDCVHFLGNRSDIPQVLAAMDVFSLTSHMEANPVSILEALATGKAVVAPAVGSIGESVIDNQTGFLSLPGKDEDTARHWMWLLGHLGHARQLGANGRKLVQDRWSLETMVAGYENLIESIHASKRPAANFAIAATG